MSPLEPGVLVGGRVQLTARTFDANGDELEGRVVTWTSSNSAIAVVDTTGAVTGVSAGFVTIVARSEGRTASVGVTVSLVPVASITVTPTLDTIVSAQTTQLSAELFDASGASLGARPMVWSTSNASIATVSSGGLVLGVAPGEASITVSSGGQSAETRIVVRPRPVSAVIVSPGQAALIVGQSVSLSVQVTDDNGTLLSGRPVQYASANSAVAQVSSSGVIVGVSSGATTITVSSEGKTAQVPVTVSPVPVASVRIEPTSVDLIIGGTRKLTATTYDASGAVLQQRPIAWTSGSPSVATISNDGTVTAVAPGTAVIVASSEGRVATATVNVRVVPVGTVVVGPSAPTVIVGDAVDMTFVARDASGNVLDGRVAFWTSSNETVAVVSSAGRVVGLAPGTAQITASVDGTTGSTTVTVIVEPVLTIGVQPSAIALHPTQTAQIAATPRGRNGVALTGRTISYTSGDVTIATVSNTGLVTALKPGTTTITVASEGKTATVAVTITPVPVATIDVSLASPTIVVTRTTTATATLRDSAGTPIVGRAVTWSSSNALVATVSQEGLVTALLPGSAQITATAEGKSGSATVTVSLAPVSTIAVTLTPSAVQVGQTAQATALLRDAFGNTLTNRSITWTSSNTSVASIGSDGEIVALSQGTTTITASSEGRTGSASLSVSNLPVNSVTVTLDPASIVVGETSQATALLRAANGTILSGRAHTWSSSNTAVATVNAQGVVTALSAGSASITASSEGRNGSATLTVTNVPVASVTVTLTPPSVQVGQTSTATATLRDANGNVLAGRVTTWSSSNTSVATINSAGTVTTLAPGTVTITGTSETRTGSATLTVTAPPVATISVIITPSTVAVGQGATADAVLRDANNNVLTGRTVTWESSNTEVATVNATTGAISTLSVGTAFITARSEGQSGAATLTVTAGPVETVTVTLQPSSVVEHETSQASAVLRDANGNSLDDRDVVWTSSNTAIATVDAAGLVKALRPGAVTITASSEGRTGNAQLTVTPAAVASVTVSPSSATVDDNGPAFRRQVQLTAQAFDAEGRELLGRTFSWSSNRTSVATVSNQGLVTGRSEGTATITATTGGRSGTAVITVRD